jgi:hypothetical protein
MSDTYVVCFRRGAETAPAFGARLRALAVGAAEDPRTTAALLHVDDGTVGAPPDADQLGRTYDAMLCVTGLPVDDLPEGDAVYRVGRRVMKDGHRRELGARTPGFTILCPTFRAPFLEHAQFDAHWRDNHAPIHIASSPGTCHYEQLVVHDVLTPGTPSWDGIGWLCFATPADYSGGLFDGEVGRQAIFDDVARFLDLERGETVPTNEFVYRDERT